MVHKEINLNSPSKIIHSVLVRHEQTQMCLQSDPKCYEWIFTKFRAYIFQANFLLPYSLNHWCIHSKVVENWLQLQLCSFGVNAENFVAKKPFTILNALFFYSFSFDPSLWWPLLLSMVAIKGHARLPASPQASCIMSGFPHHLIMHPTHDDVSW